MLGTKYKSSIQFKVSTFICNAHKYDPDHLLINDIIEKKLKVSVKIFTP